MLHFPHFLSSLSILDFPLPDPRCQAFPFLSSFFSPSLTREVDGAKFSGWLHPLAIWRAFPRCKGTITRETSNYSKLLTEQRFFLFLFLFFVSNRSRQLARVFRGQVSELSNWGPFDCVYICDYYRLFTPGDHQTFAYVLELQSIGQL